MSKDKREQVQPSSRNRILGLVGIGILLMLLFWQNQSAEQSAKQVLSDDVQIALGGEVFDQNCARCHGAEGEGHAEVELAPALNGSEHTWHHADGVLQGIVADGSEIMPTFSETLSHEEIISVIRYLQIWWPDDKLASQQNASKSIPFLDQ